MMSIRGSETGTRLDIRTRRILAPDGTEVARLTIFCPRRRLSLEVEECRRCESCEEIVIDPAERNSAVRCKVDFEDQSAVGEFLPQPVSSDARLALRTPVQNLMTRNVICVRSDVTVNELIMTLFENGISGAPVVDTDGKLIGIVSKTDLLRDSYEKVELAEENSWRHAHGGAENQSRPCVRDLMTTSVSALPESATIAEAAALMALEGVRKVPILDSKEQVVGVISASDVLTWLARQAGYVVPSRFPVRR